MPQAGGVAGGSRFIREVGLSRFRHRDRVSISPSMPFPISMLEHRIQGWAMPSG